MTLEASGTVKFGDFSVIPSGIWKTVPRKGFFLPMNTLALAAVMSLLGLMAVFFAFRLTLVVKEGAEVNRQALALINGTALSPEYKQERIQAMKKKGMGLRFKFVLLVTALVICVVLMVSLPLGSFMTNVQRQNLAKSLKSQAEVLLESLASGARSYLPLQRTLELRLLPTQRTAMTDSTYVTITGEGLQDSTRFEYVWATDDPDILDKIQDERFTPGISLINDEISMDLDDLARSINEQAEAQEIGRASCRERV